MSTSRAPTYLPLVTACGEHGISRNVAFRLQRDGLLDTFLIGKRRYVYLDSLSTLPERLQPQSVRLGAGCVAWRVSDINAMPTGGAK